MSLNVDNEPDFYNKVHLKDYKTLDKAVAMVKSMVLDADESYAKHITAEMVKPFFLNKYKREMQLSTLKNPFIRRIKNKIKIEAMEEWHGISLGSLDNKRYDQGLDSVKGQSRIYLKNDGDIKKISHYGSQIGPSGSEITPPDLSLSHIRVEPNDWPDKVTGVMNEGWNVMMVENTDQIPISELKTRLFGHATEVIDLEISQKYKPILLRGTIGMVSPVDRWIETDKLVPDLKNGEEQHVQNPDGTYKTHKDTGARIVKMKYKREKDGVGQPLKQCKHGSEITQWVFKVSLFNVDGESDNRVSVQFQQTRLGSAHILMQNADLVLNDAGDLPIGGSEDPFTSLQNMWGGKEVVIAGTIISADEYQDKMWYGINGTIIMDEELVSTVPIEKVERDIPKAPVTAPISEPMPVIVGETFAKHETSAEVTYEPEPVNQPVDGPTNTEMVYPSGAEVKETPTPKMTSDEENAKALDRAIINAIATLGDDIDYDMLMSMSVGMPDKFKDPLQELPVRKALDRIRKEHVDAKTVVESPTISEETPTEMKPSDRLTPEKLLKQIGAGDTDEIEIISDPDDKKVPPGHIRCICGEIMPSGMVESHRCVQK